MPSKSSAVRAMSSVRSMARAAVTLSGRAELVKGVTLEQRVPGDSWQTGRALTVGPDFSFSVAVTPTATTEYRLAAGTAKSAPLRVVVGS